MFKIYYIKNGIKNYLSWSLDKPLHYAPISEYVIEYDKKHQAEWSIKREHDRGITEQLYIEE